jgi:hypothetical protein
MGGARQPWVSLASGWNGGPSKSPGPTILQEVRRPSQTWLLFLLLRMMMPSTDVRAGCLRGSGVRCS